MGVEDEVPDLLVPDSRSNNLSKVPITIITGFLGAGKTTLLQYILNVHHGHKIAVIMNEFTDSADIEGRSINVKGPNDAPDAPLSEEILELANGCLCCSIKDSGAAAIEKLMQKRGRFDYILLETTGLADPGPIASMFWENETMSEAIYLDGVVCVVDALFGMKIMDDPDHVVTLGASQVATADVILLNKTDLASSLPDYPSLESTEAAIRRLNPTAPIHRTVRGTLDDLKMIIGLNSYASNPFRDIPLSATTMIQEDHDHNHEHLHVEIGGISSMIVPLSILNSDQLKSFDRWLSTLLWEGRIPPTARPSASLEESKVEILRCKGIINTVERKTFLLQGVRTLYELTELPESPAVDAKDDASGKLALIGRFSSHGGGKALDSVEVRRFIIHSLSAALGK